MWCGAGILALGGCGGRAEQPETGSARAFVWSADWGFRTLMDELSPLVESVATAVSADGEVVAGVGRTDRVSSFEAFSWSARSGLTRLRNATRVWLSADAQGLVADAPFWWAADSDYQWPVLTDARPNDVITIVGVAQSGNRVVFTASFGEIIGP